ncbi:bacteriohemerythrin [Desulfovibrio inopinatus]|uniref:bacteriohemerythrin n=1 Tax=Desulfovibrio inopinatus TaxID=102109 RepID=UPI0003F4CCDB|nr:bacteriohemerythrin [Desulfovibrio inopinatus]
MAILEWSESLSVNIHIMDEQHHQLLRMVNTLYDAMQNQTNTDPVHSILEQMHQYAITHFGTEEAFMEQHTYPEILPHKEEHQKFIDKISQIRLHEQTETAANSIDLINFLSNWLVDHIHGTDKKLGAYLASCGVH